VREAQKHFSKEMHRYICKFAYDTRKKKEHDSGRRCNFERGFNTCLLLRPAAVIFPLSKETISCLC
jgi:hypothetical protein